MKSSVGAEWRLQAAGSALRPPRERSGASDLNGAAGPSVSSPGGTLTLTVPMPRLIFSERDERQRWHASTDLELLEGLRADSERALDELVQRKTPAP